MFVRDCKGLLTSFTSVPTTMDRRTFVSRSAAGVGAAALAPRVGFDGFGAVVETPMMPPVAPITDDERRARIEKARKLMVENGIGAIFIEGGTSMNYFTGV